MRRTSMSSQMSKRGRAEQEEEPRASQSKRSRAAEAMESSQSHATQSTQRGAEVAKKAAEALSAAERQKMIAAMVRFLLLNDKKKLPVKRSHIVEHVPGLKEATRAFPVILEGAQAMLKEVFGFDVLEADVGTQRFYLVVNALKPGKRSWGSSSEQLSLLVLVLSVIFMKEQKLKDEDLTLFLEKMGIEKGGRKHQQFGDVDKLLTAFCQQKYLDRVADSSQEDTKKRTYLWSWGARSYLEISAEQVFETLSMIYEQDVDDWKLEFKGLMTGHEKAKATFIS